jgi:hypothetical protein
MRAGRQALTVGALLEGSCAAVYDTATAAVAEYLR